MLTVRNSSPDDPVVTLFGQMEDGSFAAATLGEDEVPYGHYWPHSIDQRMVYIAPDEDALSEILRALREHRLDYEHLQDLGSTNGGVSQIPI